MEELDRASLLRMLEYLRTPRDLAACEQACRTLHALARAPTVWAPLLLRDYGLELVRRGSALADCP